MKHLVENFLLLSVLLVTLFIGGCQKDLTIEPDLSTAREDTDSLSTQSYCAFEGDNHYSALRYLYMDLKYRDFRYDFIQSIPKSTGTPIWDLTVIDYKKEGMFGLLPFVNEQNEVSAIMTFRSYKDEPIAYTLISTEQMKAVMDKATESYQDFDLVYTYYIWMNAYNFGMNGKLDKDAEYYVNLYKQISGSGKTDDFFPLLDELIDLLKRLLGGGGGGGPTEDVHDPSDKCPKFGQYQSTHGSGSGGNNGNSGSGSGDTYLYIGGLGFISYSFGSSDNGTGTSGGGGSSSTNSSDQTTEWLVWQIINYYVGTGEYTYQDVLNPMYQDPNSPHLYYNDNDYTTDPTFNIELIAEAYDPCFFFVCEEDNEEEVSISQNFWSSFDEYIFFEAQKYVLQKYGLDLPPYLLFQIVDDIDCIGVSEANGEIDTACIDAAMQGFLLQQIGISGETNCFYSKPQVWESLRVYLKQNVLDIDIPENTSSAYALSFFSEDIQLIGRFYLEGICDSHYNKDIGMFYADMLAFYDTEFDWINNPSELGDVIAVIDNNGCFNGEYLDEECFWGPYATQVYDELLVLYPELSGIDISSYTATVESSKQLITATKLYDAQHLYGNWNVPDEETMLFYMEMLKVAVKEVFGIVIPFIPYIGDAADIYLSCQNGLNFECTFAVAGLFFTDEFTNFFKPSTYNKIKTVWKLSIQFEVLKQAWKALKNTGLRTDIHLGCREFHNGLMKELNLWKVGQK